MAEEKKVLRCSFCGKAEGQVHRMIQGPGVRICDECVQLCMSILDSPMLRIYSAVLRLCTSLDAMLQGLMCMLDFVAIASFLCLQLIYFARFRRGVLRGNP